MRLLVWFLLLSFFPSFCLGCYGINEDGKDDISDKSNETDSLTEPWFCDACEAGVKPVSMAQCVWSCRKEQKYRENTYSAV